MLMSVAVFCSFVVLISIPYTTVYLSNLEPLGIWVIFYFFVIKTLVLWTLLYMVPEANVQEFFYSGSSQNVVPGNFLEMQDLGSSSKLPELETLGEESSNLFQQVLHPTPKPPKCANGRVKYANHALGHVHRGDIAGPYSGLLEKNPCVFQSDGADVHFTSAVGESLFSHTLVNTSFCRPFYFS